MIPLEFPHLSPSDVGNSGLIEFYTTMLKIRMVEDSIAGLVEEGEVICPCHLYSGQEGVACGVCAALTKDDWVFSTHRSHGHYIAKGGDIRSLMAEIFCRETGCSKGRGGSMHISSPAHGLPGSSAIVAGTISLAAGAALAFSLEGSEKVSVAFFGDGATNEGVFYESLNFAALHHLPVIFVCENNLYSTHMPISSCLAETDISKKAVAMGVPSVRIDGNDILEVYSASKHAVEAARKGDGPFFIECMTYRLRGHVGPSDDIEKGLRDSEELEYWMNKSPIVGMETVLLMKNILNPEEIDAIKSMVANQIEEAISFARESPYPHQDDWDNCSLVFNEGEK